MTVPNRAPVVADTIPAQTVEAGDAATVDMTPYFNDPDGDALTYMAVAVDPTVAVASVVEASVTVTAIAKGETTITVTATDTEGFDGRPGLRGDGAQPGSGGRGIHPPRGPFRSTP